MATIVQSQPQQPQNKEKSQNADTNNIQHKKFVYTKYRDLLGSYNDKANTIIEKLPKYYVKNGGFNFLSSDKWVNQKDCKLFEKNQFVIIIFVNKKIKTG